MTRTVYISGPITGIPEGNRPAFAAMAARLTAGGWRVINPHDLCDSHLILSWEEYMRQDLAALLTCTHIVMLEGWEQSRGARLEKLVADAVRIHTLVP
jgi:hypothetical protein